MAINNDAHRLICERILERAGASGRDNVAVRLFEPFFSPHEDRGDYLCAFEIDGLDEPISNYASGIDTLGALIAARTEATYALWPVRHELRWLDGPYDSSIADCMHIRDGGRRRQIRAILDEEQYAFKQAMVAMELITRAKASQPAEKIDASARAAEVLEAKRIEADRDAKADGRRTSSNEAPIGTRMLKVGFHTDVLLRVWSPVCIRGAGHPDLYQADFQVVGAADSERYTATGTDAMQAIFLAICGLDGPLNPWRDDLTWFDLPYEDPAITIHVSDAGRLRRIHAMIDEELYAHDRLRRTRHRWRAERAQPEHN